MLHLPNSLDYTLHFYRYLCTHVLIANKQFLLLINVPIQDRLWQITIYKNFTLDIQYGNFTAHYDITTKYLGITKEETMAVELSSHQFQICQAANGQFCIIPTPFQPLANPPTCFSAVYARNLASITSRCSLQIITNKENFLHQHTISYSTKCLHFNYSTFHTNKHYYSNLSR